MYCSNADLDDCTWHESKVRTPSLGRGAKSQVVGGAGLSHHSPPCMPCQVRKGLRGKFYGLEDLFYKYGE